MKVKELLGALEHRNPRVQILGNDYDGVTFNILPHLTHKVAHLGELDVKSFEIHMDEALVYDANDKCEENEGELTDVTNESVIVIWV